MTETEATPASVRKLLVETMETIACLKPGRVLVEGKTDHRPSEGLYCTLWFKRARPEAYNDAEEYEDIYNPDVFHERLRNETLVEVQVSFWGDGAQDAALETVSRLHRSAREKDLWRVIGFAGVDSVQDIPSVYEGQIRQRALFNLQFYVCYGRRYPAECFDVSNIAVVWVRPGGEEITKEFDICQM